MMPKKTKAQLRSKHLTIPMTTVEMMRLERVAGREGLPKATWARIMLLERARVLEGVADDAKERRRGT